MQISLQWLNQYISLDQSIPELTRLLTFSGIEVEGIIPYGEIPDSIITAFILEARKLEGSDHLHICQVDTGAETLQVVCGAPNCTQGITVALATVGTQIGELTIKQARIRKTESSGMLCSERELGLSEEHGGIIVLPPETPLGIPVKHILNLPDTIFELEITPNRPDLLGYLGIATDLAASTGNRLMQADIENVKSLGDADEPIDNYLTLDNQEPDLCPRYTSRVLRNIKVQDSPLWLKQRLVRSGMRPINNIVDITNYIMLETGHPLHAFDYDKLDGKDHKPVIIIRRATQDEAFPALDGKTYLLDNNDLVIADAHKPVALAGVIGGANSHITASTVNIVLEAACFNGSAIRRTAFKHKINTDSAYRFERHLAEETTIYGSSRAAQLILELAAGFLCAGILDDWQNPSVKRILPLRKSKFEQVIGLSIPERQMTMYLQQLGLTFLKTGAYAKPYPLSADAIPELSNDAQTAMYFEIPAKRVDLEREIDLVEEIIRLHGMDKVAQKTRISHIMDRHAYYLRRKASDYLVACGAQEMVNLSFSDPELLTKLGIAAEDIRCRQITLINPQNSRLSVMRTSLIPQLLINADYNLNHSERNLRLFELNKVFYENEQLPKLEPYRLSILWLGQNQQLHWKMKPVNTDFFQLKGIILGLLENIGITTMEFGEPVSSFFSPGVAQSISINGRLIAEYGKLNPAVAARFNIDTVDLKQDVWLADIDFSELTNLTRGYQPAYQSIARYPSVERDISFLIRQDVSYDKINLVVRNTDQEFIQSVILLDEYEGKQVPSGFRSLTFRIIFNSQEKTLTDDEVETVYVSIINNLKSQWDIQQR